MLATPNTVDAAMPSDRRARTAGRTNPESTVATGSRLPRRATATTPAAAITIASENPAAPDRVSNPNAAATGSWNTTNSTAVKATIPEQKPIARRVHQSWILSISGPASTMPAAVAITVVMTTPTWRPIGTRNTVKTIV
ncbi:hypothetical protein HQ535_12225 [bacterium]|nr:hypothetical protein [bacterium]